MSTLAAAPVARAPWHTRRHSNCATTNYTVKILYVSQYYPPEMGAPAARAAELAFHWAATGHEPTVLTGFPNHPTGIVPPESVSYTHLRAHETPEHLVCRLLLE